MNNVTGSLALWLLVGSGCGMRWLERMGMWIGPWPSPCQIMGDPGQPVLHAPALSRSPSDRVANLQGALSSFCDFP